MIKDCLALIKQQNPKLKASSVDELMGMVDIELKHNPNTPIEQVFGSIQAKLARAKKIKRLAHLKNTKVISTIVADLEQYPKEQWDERLRILLSGGTFIKNDVLLAQQALSQAFIGRLSIQLGNAKLDKAFVNGELDSLIAIERGRLNGSNVSPTGNPEALQIATIINDIMEELRIRGNDAGLSIGKLEGYNGRTTYGRIDKLTEDEYFKLASEVYDWKTIELTAGREITNKEKFIRDEYKKHIGEKARGTTYWGQNSNNAQSAKLGGAFTKSRKIHFLEGGWVKHNEAVGDGLVSAVVNDIDRLSRAAAAVDLLGTNPVANVNSIVSILQHKHNGVKIDTKRLDVLLDHITGEAHIKERGNEGIANTLGWIRTAQRMSDLVYSAITGFFSDGLSASHTYSSVGMRYSKGTIEQTKTLFKTVKGKEQQMILDEMMMSMDTNALSPSLRLGEEKTYNLNQQKANHFFFKYVAGLSIITDRSSLIHGRNFMKHAGTNRQSAFGSDGMVERLELALKDYNITAKEWDFIRKNGAVDVYGDGNFFITPLTLSRVSDDVVGKFLKTTDVKKIRVFRNQVFDKYHQFVYDKTTTSAIRVNEKTTATILKGDKAGSVAGEVRRSLFTYKGVAVAFWQRSLKPFLADRTADGLGEFNKLAVTKRLSLTLGHSVLLGYGVYTVRSVIQGKEPLPLYDEKGINSDVAIRSLVIGGGGGIALDLLLGVNWQNGIDGAAKGFVPLYNVAEPTLGLVAKTAKNAGGLVGVGDGGADVSKDLYKLIRGVTPQSPFLKVIFSSMLRDGIDSALDSNLQRKHKRSQRKWDKRKPLEILQ